MSYRYRLYVMFGISIAVILACVAVPLCLVAIENLRHAKHIKFCETQKVWQGTWFDDCKCRYCKMFNKLVEENKLTDEDVEAMQIIGDSFCSKYADSK